MSLLDKFMETYGSGDWNFNALSEPKLNIVAVDVEGALSLADFIEGVLRVPGARLHWSSSGHRHIQQEAWGWLRGEPITDCY